MNTNLKNALKSLVELSKTDSRALDYLAAELMGTADRKARQQIELAIVHAERNAASL